MSDLFGGIQKSLSNYSQSWLLSSVLATGLWAFFIFPLAKSAEPFRTIDRFDASSRAVSLAFVALGISILLSALALPTYRILEGYHWPSRIRNHRIVHHQQGQTAIVQRIKSRKPLTHIQQAQLLSQMDGYPRDFQKIFPTRLGNTLRAAETYGSAIYGIDTVTWWFHLSSLAPESLVGSLERHRIRMDFMMSVLITAPLFSAASVWAALAGGNLRALFGLVALAAIPLAYLGIVSAAREYGSVVTAIVDLSRKPLAHHLGLVLPQDIAEERILWFRYNQLSAYGGLGINPEQLTWESEVNRHRTGLSNQSSPST